MSQAANISALVTIIFGLMLTDLFASVHRLIRHRRRVRWHWLPMLVAWYVLAMVLKNWWALAFQENTEVWGSGWIFLFYGHLFLLLYLLVSAVLPDEIPAGGVDLKEYYFTTRRHFWGLQAGVSLLLLGFSLLRPLFWEQTLSLGAVLSNAIMAAVAVSLAWSGRFAYHAVIVIVMVTLMALEMAGKF